MATKIQSGKDVASYKWVKIIQSLLLIVFGIVLCAFSGSKDIQNALGYITASILLLYGILTIGFGLIFSRGTLSAENVSGCALIALSTLIFITPDIVMTYIPTFAGVMFLSFGLIFLIEGIINSTKKSRHIRFAVINYLLCVLFAILGIVTLVLNYSSDEANQDLIKMVLIIFIGIILIISGIFLIVYYGFNPKFKVKETTIVSKDGSKRVTIVEGSNIPVDDPDELIEEKKASKSEKKKAKKNNKKAITQKSSNDDSDKNEVATIN